ncbi:MAG: ATP-binding protein [Candidatus Babeliales bacterium]
MFISRILERDIIEGARYFPVVAILGPRQSGKTTLAKKIFAQHAYVSLEDVDKRTAAIEDPRTFLQLHRNEAGLIIDEFQYAPDLLSYIQTTVDAEQRQGFFILTGSQNFLMNQAITQSLAGRISLHTLLPLCSQELSDQNLLPDEIEPLLFQGLYPAIYTKQTPPERLYSQYVRTYLERDVRQLTHVGDLATFQTFLMMCAERVGQRINMSEFARQCRISDQTVARWLSILEASYIIFRLHPFEKTLSKRFVKTAKLYFYDPGLACYLLKMNQDDLVTSPRRGNIFESFIISEIVKQAYNHGHQPAVYFFQDQADNEVDCIIDLGNKMIALEIKASRTINTRFFDGLTYLKKSMPNDVVINDYVIYGANKKQISGYKNVVSWQAIADVFKS